MKLTNKLRALTLAVSFSMLIGCGGASSDNSSNANGSNRSSSGSSTPDPNRDMSPVSVTGPELSEKEHKGREVTVSELRLKEITPTRLKLVNESGVGFLDCEGDFNSYMSSAKRVEELASQGISKAPTATIKGIYVSSGSSITISPCVLIDLER